MNTSDTTNTCANCGSEGDHVKNICNKCNQVKYCNAACKKKHRHKHKKDCEEHQRLAAERAAEVHDIELFKRPPPLYEECPICFQRMPSLPTGYRYKSCCGKQICSGCIHAPVYDNQGNKVDNEKCPFCRTTTPESNEEKIKRADKLVEGGYADAMNVLGSWYAEGKFGLPQDHAKALELYHRAGELGNATALHNMGFVYGSGRGVEVDNKKAIHYYELAAMRGHPGARYVLGSIDELRVGDIDRSIKHYVIAVGDGNAESLTCIRQLYSNGVATKDDYTTALHAYQEYLGEIKSSQRDEAAAADDAYRYY